MTTTLDLCRDQQAYHRNRADMAVLENVRIISTKAALAWEREATRAAQREANGEKRRLLAEANALAAAPDEAISCEAHERPLSENPDRGFAAP